MSSFKSSSNICLAFILSRGFHDTFHITQFTLNHIVSHSAICISEAHIFIACSNIGHTVRFDMFLLIKI